MNLRLSFFEMILKICLNSLNILLILEHSNGIKDLILEKSIKKY